MGTELNAGNSIVLDLSKSNTMLEGIDFINSQSFHQYIHAQMVKNKAVFAIGGYGEKRAIYSRSKVFAQSNTEYRNIHLGLDIWTAAGHPVYCPLEGRIHSFRDNAGLGNYGPTVILEHQLHGNIVIYSLYGHLSRKDLENLEIGKKIPQGEKIGHLGDMKENGDWPAHLHFQLIRDMEGNVGDYPGVCAEKDAFHYLTNCPDPNEWLNCALLNK